MKYLITGGAGFIGSHIVKKLVNLGNNVTVFDDFSTGNIDNLKEIKNKIKIIKGDISNLNQVKKAAKNIDYISHHAAIPSVQMSIKNPLRAHNVNLTGTLNILLAAKENKVKRVVFAGSASVYGNEKSIPKKETTLPLPVSAYGIHKLTAEKYCKLFSILYRLDTVVLRYFNAYGPNQSLKSDYATVIPIFITRMLRDKSPIIFGDGKQTRDFVYIDNLVDANIKAFNYKKKFNGDIFNIASGQRYNLIELINHLNKIIGKKIMPVFGKEKKGEVRHSLADISKAKKLLKYKPVIGFKEGLKITYWSYTKLLFF